MSIWLPAQMKFQCFDSMDPTSFIEFFHALKKDCNSRKPHEGAAIGCFTFLLTNKAAAALKARLSLKYRSWHGSVKNGMLTPQLPISIHLLET